MPSGRVTGRGGPDAGGQQGTSVVKHADLAEQGQVRLRLWCEVLLAGLSGILGALTAIWPGWVETVTGLNPDGHSGSLEWVIVGVLLAVSMAVSVTAVGEWRRGGRVRHERSRLALTPGQTE